MHGKGFVEINEIQDILGFVTSIDWSDSWLIGLVAFHVIISVLVILTRRRSVFQICFLFTLLATVYFSENLNALAALHWEKFSKQQYFDSNGLFISVMFSSPILLNCMFILFNVYYTSFELMKNLKQAQEKVKRKTVVKED